MQQKEKNKEQHKIGFLFKPKNHKDSCPKSVQVKNSTITWKGDSDKSLEDYVNNIKGHIAQQDKLAYILHPEVHRLWLKHGDPYQVLFKGLQQNIHVHLTYIMVYQFKSDIMWLFGALQGSLLHKGKMIVKEYDPSQDGICVWHKFLATYRFGGNLSLYIGKQQEILTKHYHLHYPGGASGFLMIMKKHS